MGKLKDQLAGIAALIAAIVAIGGGFVKYGEIVTKLDALESQEQSVVDTSAIESKIAVLEEKVAKLKELWGKGNTASQIAEIIGGISRNAVIGKAHRLNLSAKIKTRTATSNKSFETSNAENKIKSKRGRKSKFQSLIIEKDFEPENPKQLEELEDEISTILAGGQVGRVVVNLN